MNKKIVLVILLVVFLTGIAIAPVNAKKHTYKYGKYKFTTGRGGTAEFTINNISREILIDKII